jgi:hypothetical protein
VREECWVLTKGTEEEEDGGGLNGLSGAIEGLQYRFLDREVTS